MIGVDAVVVDQVEVTFKVGAWEIWCSWPQKARRSDIATIMRVRLLSEDPVRLVLSSTRVNLLSTSAKNGVAAALRKQGADQDADLVIHHIAESLLDLYRQAGFTTEPQPRPRVGDSHLLYPVWPATGGTLIVGGTNTFKSLLAMGAAVQTSTAAEVLGGNTRRPTEPLTPFYLDWEGDEPAFSERLFATLQGAGLPLEPCVAYRQMTQSLADAADTIRDEINRQKYPGVIIDSLSAAAGGSLVDDELANQFWNAVAYLGVPCLVLAHKSQEAIRRGHQRAFGSVMHENRSRMMWDVHREPDSNLVRWEVISDNNTGRKGDTLAWRIDIKNEGEHQNRRLDTIQFTAVNPQDVRQAPNEGDTLPDRIAYQLTENGPMTSGEIATALGLQDNSIRNQLSRHKTLFTKRTDTRWELKT